MNEIQVLIYSTAVNEAWKRFRDGIESFLLDEAIEIHHTIEGLAGRLRKPFFHYSVVVLYVESTADLSRLISINDLLHAIDTIIILPDRESETIKNGHILRPRFLTFKDTDISEVYAVLKKMLERIRAARKQPGRTIAGCNFDTHARISCAKKYIQDDQMRAERR